MMGGTTVLGFVDPQHKLLDIETLVIPEGIERNWTPSIQWPQV